MSKRNQVKIAIWEERTDWSLEPPCPRCDVCGEPLPAGCDMHEAIVPKRTAMGWPKKQRGLINHKFNCVLVCSGTGCHLWAHAHPNVIIAHLIIRYGWKALDEWVKSLPFKALFVWHRGILSEDESRCLI